MPQVHEAHTGPAHRLVDRPVGRAPADDDEVALVRAELEPLVRYEVCDGVDLRLAEFRHALVIVRVVGDMSGDVVFLDTARAMHEARHAGRYPGAPETVRVALAGEHLRARPAARVGRRVALDRCQCLDHGDEPGLRCVRQVAVDEQDHRRHMPQGDAHALDGHVEAFAGRRSREHGYGRVRVAPVNRLVQVRLFRLRRQARGRPAALPVDDQQWQLGAYGEPHRLCLQRDAGSRTGGHAYHAAVGGPDRGADRCDLVLRLERAHAEFLQPREPVQQWRGGRDRIGAEQHRLVGEFARGRNTQR